MIDSEERGQIEESLDAIEAEQSVGQITEQPSEQTEGLYIADEREQKAGPNHPFRHKLAQFVKSGWGKTLIVFVLIVGVALAVPMTRYALLGVFIKKQVAVTVVDETTGKPVSDADVHYARADGKTDKNGVATLDRMAVGDHPLTVEKKYYETSSTSYTVPVFGQAKTAVKLKATGRLATVKVTNAVSGKLLVGVNVKIGDTSAVSDDNGVATVALAIRSGDQPGTATLGGYLKAEFSTNTKDISPTVEVRLTPEGKLYFLTNRSGKYDIMSSTLDGVAQEVVTAGTGKENPYEVQLLASPSGKTLAFLTRRDGDANQTLYMVDTATKGLARLEGDARSINLVGWGGDVFYYTTYNDTNGVVDGRSKLMSYNQASKKTTQLDTSRVVTDNYNQLELSFSQIVLAGGRPYYAKCWSSTSYWPAEFHQKAAIMTVADGKLLTLKTIDQTKSNYCSAIVKKPNLVYFSTATTYNGADTQYFRYQVGKAVEPVQLSDADFIVQQTAFWLSPNGEQVFWTEQRDGKQVSYVSSVDGSNVRQTGGGDDFYAAGWLSDDYIIYSKKNNELYVMAANGQGDMHKVTDYYAPMALRY